jgi:membrane protease YdiL (CAAX protease family)
LIKSLRQTRQSFLYFAKEAGSQMEESINVTEKEETKLQEVGKRSKLLEIGVVIFIIAAPSLASWGCNLFWDGEYQKFANNEQKAEYQSTLAYNVASFKDIILHLRYIPVILFFMWKSGEGWAHYGIVKPRLHKDVIIGIGLAFIIIFKNEIFNSLFDSRHGWSFHWDRFYPAPVPVDLGTLLLGRCFAIALTEELVGRSYLIPRLEELTGSSRRAIIISSVVFGLLHSYKSVLGILLSFLSACIWGITFCKIRRIWPLVISHAIIDYIIFTRLNSFIGLW